MGETAADVVHLIDYESLDPLPWNCLMWYHGSSVTFVLDAIKYRAAGTTGPLLKGFKHLIPKIRLLKRCKTANPSRVLTQALRRPTRVSREALRPDVRRDSDSPSYIV